jgi:ribosomal protein S20
MVSWEVMMPTKMSFIVLALCAMALAASPTTAGPFSDFEEELRDAYAVYRAALFQTNKKDKVASEQTVKQFSAAWGALAARWGKQPPPQYSDGPGFAGTLVEVKSTIEKAHEAIAKGDLGDAHEILERIRDLLGDLRSRHGIITFSDRMNAYHELMEQILTKPYGGYDAGGLRELHEDAAVLAYLYRSLERHPPVKAGASPEFVQALSAVKTSVEALLASVRNNDSAAAKQAVQRLKQPYSLLFLKFG